MKSEVHDLIRRYHEWVIEKTELVCVADHVIVHLPYLDRHNDYMHMFIKPHHDGYLLSDHGYTISDLIFCGYNFSTEFLRNALSNFGVELRNKAIEIMSNDASFAASNHSLIQAMIAINELPYVHKAQNRVRYINKDVDQWISSFDTLYHKKQKFFGKSGLQHNFDFILPGVEQKPNKLLRVLNRPDESSVAKLAFNWIDVRESFDTETYVYAVLNDRRGRIEKDIVKALEEYEVNPLPWSDRNNYAHVFNGV